MRIALLLSLVITLAAPAWAGEAANANLDVLRDTIRANRKALVAVNLRLTDAEAKDFWPVYDRYEKDLKEVNDRLVQVLDDYSSHFKDLSDEQAKKLLDDYLAVEEDRAKLRRTYVADFGKTLPGKKVARFYQIENKMDAVIRYDLAATIPVVE
ncbi:MAG TPA: hypothetical protein VGK30_08345 [Candidatus Binatia bacterium]